MPIKCCKPEAGIIGDDLALDIELVAIHDLAALARIHCRFGKKLAAICLRVTGSSDSAEDALQETYINLWNRAGSYDRNLSRSIIWLSTLTRNSAIDLVRAQVRRRTASLPPDYDTEDCSPRIDDLLIAKERQIRAVKLLEALAVGQRGHIKDIYLKGLTYVDLSKQQGIPVGTVKSRVHRGLTAMKKAWNVD